jgi:hypothetical protein
MRRILYYIRVQACKEKALQEAAGGHKLREKESKKLFLVLDDGSQFRVYGRTKSL